MKQEVFLGVSSGFHDSAAALLDFDGRIIYAASEERFSRIKGDSSWPEQSINHAITVAKRQNRAIKSVCCHENIQRSVSWHLVNCLNPFSAKFKKFETLYSSLSRYSAFVENIDVLLNKLCLTRHNLYFSDHHVSHAMAAFAYSPAASGLVCVFDAFGQGSSGFFGFFDSSLNRLRVKHNFDINHSIGLFYSAITRLCGFKVLTGEYKLMGLAPYGTPSMYKKLRDVFGNPTLHEFNTSILDPFADDIASNDLVFALDVQRRIPESSISQPYMDLAASAQIYLEELVVNILKHEVSSMPKDLEKNIILGGGVALNCKLTHRIQKEFSDFDVYICPAAGDSGSAIGACYSRILAETSKNYFLILPHI